MEQKVERIYDGAFFCSGQTYCPVIDYDRERKRVILWDPIGADERKIRNERQGIQCPDQKL
jgi:hypothetical protein